MDQLNPYQAPEPLLPTAAAVLSPEPNAPTADLMAGLKLLRAAVLLACISTVINGFWSFCDAYCYLIDDPLPQEAGSNTYWLNFWLNVLGECLAISGLYLCSTCKFHHVSRAPLLISLVLAAIVFPDPLIQYALIKPWIYFDGWGNLHAGYGIIYLGNLSWLALDCWLILWMTTAHDNRNLQRVLFVFFLDAINIILQILAHLVFTNLIGEQPTEHSNLAIFYFLSGFSSLAILISSLVLFKIYSSMIAQLSDTPTSENQPPDVVV